MLYCDALFRIGAAKSVKFWTLITIDSENCDPKRLTSRQQLAYIAKRAASSSQLMSDFQPKSGYQDDDEHVEPPCSMELDSIQEMINADLLEIAAEDSVGGPYSAVTDFEELIGLAEEEPADQLAFPGAESPSTEQAEQAQASPLHNYLAYDISMFVQSVVLLQRKRLDVLSADMTRRKAPLAK